MADKVYKLKDVPKGKKLQFFFDYYKVHMGVAAFIIAFIVIGIYEMMHVPKFDMKIAFFGENMKISESALQSLELEFEQMKLDLNEDGKVEVGVIPLIKIVEENGSSGEFNEVAYAEITIGDSVIMITDDAIFDTFLKPRNAVATCEQIGIEGQGYVKIPYENTIFNDYIKEEYFEKEMYVTVKPGDASDKEYIKQLEAFKTVILK